MSDTAFPYGMFDSENRTPNPSYLKNTDLKPYLILAALALVWGSSYILIKKALIAFDNVQVAYLRVAITGLTFLPFLLYNWSKVNWKKFPYLLVVGFSGTAIPAYLFATAQTKIDSSLAGILSSLTPLMTVLVALTIFRQTVRRERIVGIGVGLVGAVFLFAFQAGGLSGELGASLLVILAAFCYALSSNTVGVYLQDMSALVLSSASFVLVGLPAAGLLLTTEFTEVVQTHPHGVKSLLAVSFLALAGTVAASIFFFQLVKMRDAVFASVVSYLIPVVAIGWGIYDGETVTVWQIGGMVLILVGVFLSRKRNTSRGSSPPEKDRTQTARKEKSGTH